MNNKMRERESEKRKAEWKCLIIKMYNSMFVYFVSASNIWFICASSSSAETFSNSSAKALSHSLSSIIYIYI